MLKSRNDVRVQSPVMDDEEFERTRATQKADEIHIRIQTELMKLKYTPRDKIRTKYNVPEFVLCCNSILLFSEYAIRKVVEKPLFSREEILERIKGENRLKSKMFVLELLNFYRQLICLLF